MLTEDVEFQISQYVDGTLSRTQRAQVDSLLATDPHARQLLAEFTRLNAHLGQLRTTSAAGAKWDQIARHISTHVDQAEAVDEQVDEPAVAGRIGFANFKWRIAATLLIAATALIVVRQSNRPHGTALPAAAPEGMLSVTGPQAEVAAGPEASEISVGPSPALARRSDSRYGEGVISQGPSRVVIQANAQISQPNGLH